LVRKIAQKTDAKQTNKNLLLSDDATADTKPQLEIYADDVKCTHGATIGQLNDESIFYLRSRGIGADNARRMLIHAFAGEIIARVKHDSGARGTGQAGVGPAGSEPASPGAKNRRMMKTCRWRMAAAAGCPIKMPSIAFVLGHSFTPH
jgi:hypothetical protein